MAEPKILLVEDDEMTQFLVCEALQGEGYATLVAGDGDAALQQLETRDSGIRLVLLDLSIPGPPPEELMVRLRASPGGGELPVFVVSGWPDIAERAARIGAQGVLRKPVDLDDLYCLARNHVG